MYYIIVYIIIYIIVYIYIYIRHYIIVHIYVCVCVSHNFTVVVCYQPPFSDKPKNRLLLKYPNPNLYPKKGGSTLKFPPF